MDDELKKLRDELEAANKRADDEAAARAAEKKRADDEKKRADDEKKRADDEKKRADDEEEKTRRTRFFEYLDNTHTLVSAVLRVETDPRLAAAGKAANVEGKVYPRLLRRWVDFPQLHRQQFDDLATLFGDQRLFGSYIETKSVVRHLSPGKRRTEQDLRLYVREYLELPSMYVAESFLDLTTDPRYAHLDVRFSNHGIGTMKRHMDIDALVAASSANNSGGGGGSGSGSGSGRGTTTSTKRKRDTSSSLAPDRWVQRDHSIGPTSETHVRENIIPGEYKAVHKVRGSVFRSVLGHRDAPLAETFMDDCAQRGSGGSRPLVDPAEEESAERKKIRQDEVTIAEVLCQAYHYMIVYGTTYGYVTSGEASVFLMTEREDPGTLFYHLVDHADVAVPITQPESDLVRVPAAQMATLLLLALLDEKRSDAVTVDLKNSLPRWPKPAAKRSRHTSPDRPLGRSPPGGDDGDDNDGDDNDDGHSAMPPPPRPSSGARPTGPSETRSGPRSGNRIDPPRRDYCTQACLLGLVRGGPLDPACPNVQEHASAERQKRGPDGGPPWHAISRAELCAMLLEQFTWSMSAGLECLAKYGLWGHIGTLFKVTLCGYGYTFVAKGVQDADEQTLQNEAALYTDEATQHLQGVLMPVYLGRIELEEWPYCLTTGARIWHMMFLSWAGWSLARRVPDGLQEDDLHDIGLDMHWELYRHGIYHQDVREANLAWNPELGRVMALDFDRAFLMTEDEYNETPPPPVTGTCLGAPMVIESKFQAKLQAKEAKEAKSARLAGAKAAPVAADPDAAKAEKRKHEGSGEDDVGKKRKTELAADKPVAAGCL